jgi:hypothetical protein
MHRRIVPPRTADLEGVGFGFPLEVERGHASGALTVELRKLLSACCQTEWFWSDSSGLKRHETPEWSRWGRGFHEERAFDGGHSNGHASINRHRKAELLRGRRTA